MPHCTLYESRGLVGVWQGQNAWYLLAVDSVVSQGNRTVYSCAMALELGRVPSRMLRIEHELFCIDFWYAQAQKEAHPETQGSRSTCEEERPQPKF